MPESRRSPFANLTESVSNLAGQARQRQADEAARAAGKDGRGQPGHAGQRGRDKTGLTKATYALPIHRQEMVREMAAAEDCSQTDIVEAAVVALYNAWQAGQVDFSELKMTTRSLRFSWRLEIPDNFFSSGSALQP